VTWLAAGATLGFAAGVWRRRRRRQAPAAAPPRARQASWSAPGPGSAGGGRSALRLAPLAAALGLFVAEKRWPLRPSSQAEPHRTARNLVMGAASLAVVALLQRPVVEPLSRRVAERRWGLAQRLPLPAWARDAAAFLLLDYTIYAWHVLTHKNRFLWRFHLVHHLDLDMDTTTALRFHFGDMALSAPWRAAQVLACGASPRALRIWQSFFFISVLFHHANLKLPPRADRWLSRLVTTPRLHETHHAATPEETGSNFSSGLSLWDRLHRTLRISDRPRPPQLGLPAYRAGAEMDLRAQLRLPFVRQRFAWAPEGPASEAAG
jgi:sterol desaturase/sphingolipid hydroxylase (fatty acid hydroxylase superfamily)